MSKKSKQVLAMALSGMACKMIFVLVPYVRIIICRGLNSWFNKECVRTTMSVLLENLNVLPLKVFSFTREKTIDIYT